MSPLLMIDLSRIGRYLFVFCLLILFLFSFAAIFACIMIGTDDDDEMEGLFKMQDKKFMAHWYDQDREVRVDGPIYASTQEEAKNIAYRKYNGEGPAPMLWLEEISK